MSRFEKSSEIKVAVIGYGGAFNMGKYHLETGSKVGMIPTAVVDVDSKRLEAAKKDFPDIETYSSVEKMLEKSSANLVILITPHNTHAKLAVQCLKENRNVISEKPMAVTTEECDAMIKQAEKNNLMLSVFHNRHWDGSIIEAVQRIKKGEIGDVFRIEAHMGGYSNPGDWWRTSKSISGGILYDWGVHLLEYSMQIINSEAIEVTGFARKGFWAEKTKWGKDTNEDEAFAVIRCKNDTWLTLCISSIDSNPKKGMLEITGTDGTYIMNYDTWEIVTHKNGIEYITKGRNPQSDGALLFYKNIVEHLVKGKELIITPQWARQFIHILDLADQSAKKRIGLKA
ncbi:MAG: Gfo/Idh/MocA family oxidoreductase [Candidatus Omnitrophica bacterium]|jgi:predicted dehydrogenase|nr:Gfo/Idh/MocA family oxidoreductase [Candidatus Omnitrophota bacterium]